MNPEGRHGPFAQRRRGGGHRIWQRSHPTPCGLHRVAGTPLGSPIRTNCRPCLPARGSTRPTLRAHHHPNPFRSAPAHRTARARVHPRTHTHARTQNTRTHTRAHTRAHAQVKLRDKQPGQLSDELKRALKMRDVPHHMVQETTAAQLHQMEMRKAEPKACNSRTTCGRSSILCEGSLGKTCTMSDYFHLTERKAAKHFGVCLTSFKKICRARGLSRWPHRKACSRS